MVEEINDLPASTQVPEQELSKTDELSNQPIPPPVEQSQSNTSINNFNQQAMLQQMYQLSRENQFNNAFQPQDNNPLFLVSD